MEYKQLKKYGGIVCVFGLLGGWHILKDLGMETPLVVDKDSLFTFLGLTVFWLGYVLEGK